LTIANIQEMKFVVPVTPVRRSGYQPGDPYGLGSSSS